MIGRTTLSRLAIFALAAAALLVSARDCSAAASNVYIAQSASGAANGSSCAGAQPVSWFNNSANWGSGSSQIGPGTTVHICGTITGNANATGLTFQGSGASGQPVTLLFENGAVMTSPQWAAAISLSRQSNIVIDGGTNGIIENTQNGTGLAYQSSSDAINVTGGNNIEIRNLTIQNIYIHSGTGSDGDGTSGIAFQPATQSGISVHNNTIHDAQNGIFFGYTNLNGADIHDNTTFNHRWGIALLDDNAGSSATNVHVFKNDVCCFDNWFDSGFAFHFDGVFFAATNSNTSFTSSSIYSNYLHGASDVNGTGYIYLTGSGGGLNGIDVYNNVIVETSGVNPGAPEADIVLGFGPKNINIFNNTLVNSEGIRIRDSGASGIVIKNNIFLSNWMAIELYAGNTVTASDNNVFFNTNGGSPVHNFSFMGNWQGTLAAWKSASGLDSNSTAGNPNLDASYHPKPVSAAMGAGANLTNLNLAKLDIDKAGVVRPSAGPWDIGAYQSGTAVALPAPPTNLTLTVQ